MSYRSKWLWASTLAVGILATLATSGPRARADAPAASPYPNAPTCAADPSWVTNPRQPDFGKNPTVLCAFYQYAWQSFLYLTTPSRGPGSPLNFELYPSVDEVFGVPRLEAAQADSPLRLFAQVDERTQRTRHFRPRVNKGAPTAGAAGALDFDEHTQAGSGGILVDQKGNITYYEQLLDPAVAVNFIRSCSLTLRNCWTQPGAAKLRFPNGSIEIKAAWRPLWRTDPGLTSFYRIPGFEVMNARGQRVKPDFMGLVGFHLVYTAENHPEMVWATFEHVANAPEGPCQAGVSTCARVPAGFPTWSYNNCRDTSCANVNRWPFPPSPMPKPPYPITQAYLNWPWGTNPTLIDGNQNRGATNIAILKDLNASVLKILPSGSVWRNYVQTGAVWTSGGRLPALAPYLANGQLNPGVNQVGSTLLANVTMETFTQFPNPVPSPFPSPAPVQNCFTCHNTASSTLASPPPTQNPPFRVSHAFFAAPSPSPSPSCPYTTTPPTQCLKTQGQ